MWDKQQQHDGTVVSNVYGVYHGRLSPVTWWWRISSAGDIRTRKAVDNVEFL